MKIEPTVANLVVLSKFKNMVFEFLKMCKDENLLDSEDSYKKITDFIKELSVNDFNCVMASFSDALLATTFDAIEAAVLSGDVGRIKKQLQDIKDEKFCK